MSKWTHEGGWSEELARLVIERSQALVLVTDREGRLLFFSPRCEETSGYTASEVLGQHLWERLVPPEEADQVQRVLRALEQGTPNGRCEGHWITKQGERRLISWRETVLSNGHGDGPCMAFIGQDITEHRASEAAALDNQRRLLRLSQVLRIVQEIDHLVTQCKQRQDLPRLACSVLTGTEGYYSACMILVNERRMVTGSAESGLGPRFADLVEDLSQTPLYHSFQEALKHQELQVITDREAVEALLPDSATPEAAAFLVALRHGHRMFGVLGVALPRECASDQQEQALLKEVAAQLALALYVEEQEAEHERAQASAQRATEQYQAVVEATCAWIATFDSQWRVTYWNPAAETISGYSMIEVVGRAEIWEPLFPTRRYRQRVFEEFDEVLRGGGRRRLETMVVCRDGSQKLMSWSVVPLAGGTGEPMGGLLVGQDMTEQRTAWQPTRRRRRFNEIGSEADASVLVHEIGGLIREANATACRTLGYSRQELLALSAPDLLCPDERERIREWSRQLLSQGCVTFEALACRKGGDRFPVEVTMHLLGGNERRQAMDIVHELERDEDYDW